MESPICFNDIKTGKMCLLCEAKKRKGLCSDLDLKILRAIYKIDSLILTRDIEYIKAIEIENKIYLLTKKQSGFFIGKNGKVIKQLENNFKKKFKIIAIDKPEKEVLEQILDPIQISSFSRVFKQDQSQELRIRVKSKNQDFSPKENLIQEILGLKVQILSL